MLAHNGVYSTMPNPRVGCVIVNSHNEIIGEGWHQSAGEPHAEIHALAMAGNQARGATAYVTLEPCSHHGRTGPCAEALINAGVGRVVAAVEDANPSVSGKGMSRLKAAGVQCQSGVLEEEARALNEGFFKRMETGYPMVRAKLAMSLDGRTAMESGESQWITGPDARQQVQKLRAQSCAIVTGVGSVVQDNPALTLRPEQMPMEDAESICQRQPLRVILDSRLQTPADAKVITGPGQCLIFTTEQADPQAMEKLQQAGAEILVHNGNAINPKHVLAELGQRGCNEVLLETGATLAGSMMDQGLIDELVIFMAPVLLGSHARPLMQLPFLQMSEKKNLTILDIRAVGQDWKITARPAETH